MVIPNICETFDTVTLLTPPPSTISIEPSPQAHHLDTFDTTRISVQRGYSIGNSLYLGHF